MKLSEVFGRRKKEERPNSSKQELVATLSGSPVDIITDQGYQEAMKRFRGLHMGLALDYTGNQQDAEDLFQETRERIYNNREKFKGGSNFRAWSCTILKNSFINNYRKKQRSGTFSQPSENLDFLSDEYVENAGLGQLEIEKLMSRLNSIRPEEKEALMLNYQGYSYEEIATKMGKPLGTVKSIIFKGRSRMKIIRDRHS